MEEAKACAHQIEEECVSSDALREEHLKAMKAQVAEIRKELKTS